MTRPPAMTEVKATDVNYLSPLSLNEGKRITAAELVQAVENNPSVSNRFPASHHPGPTRLASSRQDDETDYFPRALAGGFGPPIASDKPQHGAHAHFVPRESIVATPSLP